ncbi:MAG: N-acetyltransferase [Thermodesulfobacteriota bacterium]|nr:N-acetyltransferase [Thermodesulfobacteriota bacterium]
MDEAFLSGVNIRPMVAEDLDVIVEIDRKVLGKARPDYWEKIIPSNPQHPFSSLVAEFEGKVVGFVMGEVSGWEFGVPDTIGWLSIIGVDPEYQHKGVARKLSQEFVKNLKVIGVSVIYTLVNWSDWDLLKFFRAMGFTRGGEMINLELKIE